MRLGFASLTEEELACTLVNPTFTIDFKKNTQEDWSINYHAKAVEKLQSCKFPISWFNKSYSISGYDDEHESFMQLVEAGDLDKIFQYLRTADITQVLCCSVEKKSKRSPLHIAAKNGNLHLVEYFLGKGAEASARDRLLKTPLHYACEIGNSFVVKLLLEHGSKPEWRDNCGRTAIHYAIYSGKPELLAILSPKEDARVVRLKDHGGRAPLHHAVFMESNQIMMI